MTIDNLIQNPVWYFCGEDIEGCDELSVSPASEEKLQNKDLPVILRTEFYTPKDSFQGFIHYQAPFSIQHYNLLSF